MSLQIVRANITEIEADAIVNPTDKRFSGGGGVDKQIHQAAGKDLREACSKLQPLQVGEGVVTSAYNMKNTRYIIHTVGPVYYDGTRNEEANLTNCYKNVLQLAVENGVETIAMPLISTGKFGYPKKEALKIATNVITDFSYDNDIVVYLLVYDKEAFDISNKLYKDIKDYLNDNGIFKSRREEEKYYSQNNNQPQKNERPLYEPYYDKDGNLIIPGLKDLKPEESFNECLRRIIIEKDLLEKDVYNNANLTKQAFNKIYNEGSIPKRENVLALAIGLKLNIPETNDLLMKAGYSSFKKGDMVDYIVKFFIEKGMYNIGTLNETLYDYGQQCLGSKEK